jgi:salicylate hydroxylase
MTKSLEIAVCGCGPAGLSAALLLKRAGHQIQLFERYDEPRPVGSGLLLQPTGLGVLAELQLLEPILQLGVRIDKLFGRAMPSQRVALEVRYDAMGNGWQAIGIHRGALFDVLHNAVIEKEIPINNRMTVEGIKHSASHAALIANRGQQFGRFDLIVDALGANSPLASSIAKRTVLEYGALWLNVPWQAGSSFSMNQLEQRYSGAQRMAGVLPIGKQSSSGAQQAAFFWSLKRSDLLRWRDEGMAKWKTNVYDLWPEAAKLIAHANDPNEITFAQYDHFTARTPYSNRLVHIGDSAHATSPQLGQGANMALIDALALAYALKKDSDLAVALKLYAEMRRWHVRPFQWASSVFTPFYQSDSRVLPFLRDWITAPLSRLPIGDAIVARLVSGMTTAPIAGTSFQALRVSKKH